MKIKLDENVPREAADALAVRGHDVHTVPSEGLRGRPDHEIRTATDREGRLLITQDLDFSDARLLSPGESAGIILLRLRARGRIALARRIEQIADRPDFASWTGCLVVVTDVKVRVRRPRAC